MKGEEWAKIPSLKRLRDLEVSFVILFIYLFIYYLFYLFLHFIIHWFGPQSQSCKFNTGEADFGPKRLENIELGKVKMGREPN